MPAVTITTDDLAPFATIEAVTATAMIADALALAKMVAPCLKGSDLDDDDAAAAKAIIRGAILRWNEAGAGGSTTNRQEMAGGMQINTAVTPVRKAMFWPAEISDLQKICKQSSGAYSIDTAPAVTVAHSDICSLNFGAEYCSCGAVLTGYAPLWECP